MTSPAGMRLHLVGIGGAGMSGLARLLLGRGMAISGSDAAATREIPALRRLGARIHIGHDARRLPRGIDGVVVSSAIPVDNVEVVAARERGCAVIPRLDALGTLMDTRRSIGVAGTHGKTTTAAMLTTILRFAGLQPSHYIGEHCPGLGSRAGADAGSWLVAEIDESDGRFVQLQPELGVLTSVDYDHAGAYGSMAAIESAFASYLAGAKQRVLCIDDPRVLALAASHPAAYTAGFHPHARVRCLQAEGDGGGMRFLLDADGERVGWVPLPAPGVHNVRNALCAIAAAVAAGVPPGIAAWGLSRFVRPSRRFEVLARGEITVVDDFAHHPEEIQMTVRAARSIWSDRRLVCVFQPHRFSRTQQLAERFGMSFTGADAVVVTDIYPAGETPLPGVTSRQVVDAISRSAPGLESRWIPDAGALHRHLQDTLDPGDVVLGLGAGDLSAIMHDLANSVAGTARGRCGSR